MALIVKEAASLSLVNPLRLLGREEGKKWGRMSLRGLPALVQQVKWPDSEKAAEKLILVQWDTALIQASGRKEPGFAFRLLLQQFTSFPPDNIKSYYECTHILQQGKKTKQKTNKKKHTFTVKQWINILYTEKQMQQNKHKLAQWRNYDRCT